MKGVSKAVASGFGRSLLKKLGLRGIGKEALLLTAKPKLTQAALEHIVERHWFSSGAAKAGKFLREIDARKLKSMIEQAAAKGKWAPDRLGRSRIEFDFGRQIGIDMNGNPVTRIRLIIEGNLDVVTAFPIP